MLVRPWLPVGLLVDGLAPALSTPACDGCGEWLVPVLTPVEGVGENVPDDRGSMRVVWVGGRRRRFCYPWLDRAAPLLLKAEGWVDGVGFGVGER